MQVWRAEKESATPKFPWIRSLRPPKTALGILQGLLVIQDHANFKYVDSIAFSPDESKLIIGYCDGTARIWNMATMKPGILLVAGCKGFIDIIYSNDAKFIVTLSVDESLRFWEAEFGMLVKNIQIHKVPVTTMTFSPDTQEFATGHSDGTVYIWDWETGKHKIILRGNAGKICRILYSPCNQWIATASEDGSLSLWDPKSGVLTATLRGHEGPICSMSYSSVTNRIVTGGADGTIRFWNPDEIAETVVLPVNVPVASIGIFSDGQHVIVGYNTIQIWDVKTKSKLVDLRIFQEGSMVVVSPKGNFIASFGLMSAEAYIFKADDTMCPQELPDHCGDIIGVKYSPDHSKIVTSSVDNDLRFWDAISGRQLAVIKDNDWYWGGQIAFSPNGSWIATGSDHKIQVWDMKTFSSVACLPMSALKGNRKESIIAIWFLVNSTHLKIKTDRDIFVWDIMNNICEMFPEEKSSVAETVKEAPFFKLDIHNFNETIVRDQVSGEIISWFSVPLADFLDHFLRNQWAGPKGKGVGSCSHLYILSFESLHINNLL